VSDSDGAYVKASRWDLAMGMDSDSVDDCVS